MPPRCRGCGMSVGSGIIEGTKKSTIIRKGGNAIGAVLHKLVTQNVNNMNVISLMLCTLKLCSKAAILYNV